MPVKITTDSTCDLSVELLKKYDIEVIPLVVSLGDKSGKDGKEVTPETIYDFVDKTGKLPKTSAVSIGEYKKIFKAWNAKGYNVVHFCIGSNFSSCYQNACIAAEEVGGIYPVNSANLSTGQGLLVLRAAEMAKEGASAGAIAEKCRELVPFVEASFVVNSIDYLHKGGRCSSLAAFGANLLKLKPCINVIDGEMLPGKKYRGGINKVIEEYAEERLSGRDDIDTSRIFITHTKCDTETIEQVKNLVREYCPDAGEILETTAGATVTTHCGPGTLGVLFIRSK